jgi:hypothetical protein
MVTVTQIIPQPVLFESDKDILLNNKTILQASNNNDYGNNKKNTASTLDIIEFCMFDNEALYFFV